MRFLCKHSWIYDGLVNIQNQRSLAAEKMELTVAGDDDDRFRGIEK